MVGKSFNKLIWVLCRINFDYLLCLLDGLVEFCEFLLFNVLLQFHVELSRQLCKLFLSVLLLLRLEIR